jgi:hypothetical protein
MRPDLVPRWAGGTNEMRIALVLGLAAILVAGCVGSGAASPEPSTTPSPTSIATPGPSPIPTPSSATRPSPTPSTPEPSIEPAQPDWPTGTVVVTRADEGLRVRSEPSIEAGSAKYEPLLPEGTSLEVLEGPVAGSGYDWYRVAILAGASLDGGLREGWVAAADRDGTPWVEACPTEVRPSTLMAIAPLTRVACFGNDTLTFDARLETRAMDIDWGPMDVPERFATVSTPDHGYIFLVDPYDPPIDPPIDAIHDLLLLRVVDPSVDATGPGGIATGFVAQVSGHFDDPASAECRIPEGVGPAEGYTDEEVVEFCRGAFIVTEVMPYQGVTE